MDNAKLINTLLCVYVAFVLFAYKQSKEENFLKIEYFKENISCTTGLNSGVHVDLFYYWPI